MTSAGKKVAFVNLKGCILLHLYEQRLKLLVYEACAHFFKNGMQKFAPVYHHVFQQT
jgi:hypothetical protein